LDFSELLSIIIDSSHIIIKSTF